MKKFLKKTEGFTLVELIVVIAILGILTAIAVPAYTGYINKAKEANDTQKLSAANTAIAAAFTENNVDPAVNTTTGSGASAVTTNNVEKYLSFSGTAGTITVEQKITGNADGASLSEDIYKDFVAYHGSATIEFDYYKSVAVDKDTSNDIPDGNLVGKN